MWHKTLKQIVSAFQSCFRVSNMLKNKEAWTWSTHDCILNNSLWLNSMDIAMLSMAFLRCAFVDRSYLLRGTSLVVLTLQNTILILVMRYARTRAGDMFYFTTAVVMAEVFKTTSCLVIILFQEGSWYGLLHHLDRVISRYNIYLYLREAANTTPCPEKKRPRYFQLQLSHFLVDFYNFCTVGNRSEYLTTICNLLT